MCVIRSFYKWFVLYIDVYEVYLFLCVEYGFLSWFVCEDLDSGCNWNGVIFSVVVRFWFSCFD